MFGLSYGETILTIGAVAVLIGPKEIPVIARTAGRIVGRSIGYIQLFRGEIESVMQQTQFRQVNKELQDTMAQLDAIRYEIRGLSVMNPGPLTRRVMDNSDESNIDAGATIKAGPSNSSEESIKGSAQQDQHQQNQHQKKQQNQYGFKAETSAFKDYGSMTSGPSNLLSQATTYSRLAEANASKGKVDDRPGLLSVIPISAESAGLLPNRQGEATGSDIVLEAVLEAEVARNAKEYFSQPGNQINSG